MDEELEHPEPKISLPEVILIGLIFVIDDVADVFLSIALIDKIIQIVLATIFVYLYFKKVPPLRQFIAWLFEMIPWVSVLPIMTIGWIVTVWADRHQDSAAAQALTAASGAVAAGRGSRGRPGSVGAKQLERMRNVDEKIAARAPGLGEHIGLEKDEHLYPERRPSRQLTSRPTEGTGGESVANDDRLRGGEEYAEEFLREQDVMQQAKRGMFEPGTAPNGKNGVQVRPDGTVDLRENTDKERRAA